MNVGWWRRAFEWLRDLDARYGYVKRARVAPGDPAPVRLRKVADTTEVVLVNPPANNRPAYAPGARAYVPAPAPLPYIDAGEPDDDTGATSVIAVPSDDAIEERADDEAEPEEGEPEDDVEAEADSDDEPADQPEPEPAPSFVPPPATPDPDAVNRLRSHRPDDHTA